MKELNDYPKIKAKMKRKVRALPGGLKSAARMAARSFIKHFNKKLCTSEDRSKSIAPYGISH